MNARYYNSETGQFISKDTYLGEAYSPWTQNLYSYTGNNPVNYVDPTGHMAISKWIATAPAFVLADGALPVGDFIFIVGCIVIISVDAFAPKINTNTTMPFNEASSVITSFPYENLKDISSSISVLIPNIGKNLSSNITTTPYITKSIKDNIETVNVVQKSLSSIITLLAKQSKTSGKERATDKPSWVTPDMVNKSISSSQNAINLVKNKYGSNWQKNKNARKAKSEIQKYIQRHIFRSK